MPAANVNVFAWGASSVTIHFATKTVVTVGSSLKLDGQVVVVLSDAWLYEEAHLDAAMVHARRLSLWTAQSVRSFSLVISPGFEAIASIAWAANAIHTFAIGASPVSADGGLLSDE